MKIYSANNRRKNNEEYEKQLSDSKSRLKELKSVKTNANAIIKNNCKLIKDFIAPALKGAPKEAFSCRVSYSEPAKTYLISIKYGYFYLYLTPFKPNLERLGTYSANTQFGFTSSYEPLSMLKDYAKVFNIASKISAMDFTKLQLGSIDIDMDEYAEKIRHEKANKIIYKLKPYSEKGLWIGDERNTENHQEYYKYDNKLDCVYNYHLSDYGPFKTTESDNSISRIKLNEKDLLTDEDIEDIVERIRGKWT